MSAAAVAVVVSMVRRDWLGFRGSWKRMVGLSLVARDSRSALDSEMEVVVLLIGAGAKAAVVASKERRQAVVFMVVVVGNEPAVDVR